MGARFYDPAIGRWLSEDPVQDRPFEPASLNFYNYASNNPVLYVDPTGTMDGNGGSGAQPTDAQGLVKEWIELYGEENAKMILRASYAAFEEFSKLGYIDANWTFGRFLGDRAHILAGVVFGVDGRVYSYVGVTFGTYGGTVTFGWKGVATGWNIAYTQSTRTIAFQIGVALGCKQSCTYYEIGRGSEGWAVQVFWVKELFRLWRW